MDENQSESNEGKYSVSVNILWSRRRFCIVILQHQVLLHIIALSFYMHNGLSIYQRKYCKNTFLSLLRVVNIQSSSSEQHYYGRSRKNPMYFRIAIKLAKAHQYLLLWL